MEWLGDLKKAACDAIDLCASDLKKLAEDIWNHPELAYKEHHAHATLTEFLVKSGFPKVEQHYVCDTGFRFEYGGEGVCVAVLCEYDALPEIGHACGHNLIAEAGVAAAIGIKAAMNVEEEENWEKCVLVVLGTPAEEGGGGKIKMLEANAFEGVSAAMMVHPASFSRAYNYNNPSTWQVYVKYFGESSHAAACPYKAINALDAAMLCYTNVSAMRQQMKPQWRIHGVVTNGGVKPSVIPDKTELLFTIRATNEEELHELKGKADACFKAAAVATGCRVEIDWFSYHNYNVQSNTTLGRVFLANVTEVSDVYNDRADDGPVLNFGVATDMGNVSHKIPSIHPWFDIGTNAILHTKEFADAAVAPSAQKATLDVAKAMAMTAIDIYCQPQIITEVKAEFEELLANSVND